MLCIHYKYLRSSCGTVSGWLYLVVSMSASHLVGRERLPAGSFQIEIVL